MNLRSPLSLANGLGSAKHGFAHWWWQRITAVALIPLSIWFIYSMLCLINGDYSSATEWMANPFCASLLLLFILTSLYHAQTGVQVVIEDYIHSKWMNLTSLLLVKFASVVMAVLSVICVLKVALGAN